MMQATLIAICLEPVMAWRTIPQGTHTARPARPAARPRAPLQMYESYKAAFQEAPIDPNVWYIFPRDPFGTLQNKYILGLGKEQQLGRYDFMDPNSPLGPNQKLRPELDGIAVDQCAVEIAQDGTHAILHALGTQPTGYRSGPLVPWTWLQPGQSVKMQNYWKISMNMDDPEDAVYKLGDGYLLRQEQEQRRQRVQAGQYSQDGQWQHEDQYVQVGY